MYSLVELEYRGRVSEAVEQQENGNAEQSHETAHSELDPQPTSHPNDPLRWSRKKKSIVIGHVSMFNFLCAYSTTSLLSNFADDSSFPLLVVGGFGFGMLPLALSPLLWAPLAITYGRRTTMVAGCFVAFVASIGVSVTTQGRTAYYVWCAFAGVGAGPASCVGLQMLHDISFTHERAQKVGIWTFAMDSGLLTGPIVLGITGSAATIVPWIAVIAFGLLFFSVLILLPETSFPRRVVQLEEAAGKDITDPTNVVPAKENPPFLNLRPIPGQVIPLPWDYILRFFRMFTFPNVTISISFYAWGWYGTFFSALGLLMSMKPSSLLFFGLVIGTFLSEVFLSGTLSDAIVKYITKTRKIPRTPEMRLWLMWPAGILSVVGLLLCAQSLARYWSLAITATSLVIFVVGAQIGNTATIT
ncbi:hypothetical protein FRB99_002438, partial [Tulasnella sp. 403]